MKHDNEGNDQIFVYFLDFIHYTFCYTTTGSKIISTDSNLQ